MTFQNYFWGMSLVFLACAGMRVSREVCACASEPIIYYIERKFIIWNNECLLVGGLLPYPGRCFDLVDVVAIVKVILIRTMAGTW